MASLSEEGVCQEMTDEPMRHFFCFKGGCREFVVKENAIWYSRQIVNGHIPTDLKFVGRFRFYEIYKILLNTGKIVILMETMTGLREVSLEYFVENFAEEFLDELKTVIPSKVEDLREVKSNDDFDVIELLDEIKREKISQYDDITFTWTAFERHPRGVFAQNGIDICVVPFEVFTAVEYLHDGPEGKKCVVKFSLENGQEHFVPIKKMAVRKAKQYCLDINKEIVLAKESH